MKLLSHFSGIFVGCFLVYLLVLLYQDHPVTAYERHYSSTDVHAGEVVAVTAEVSKSRACASTVQRIWLDQSGNILLVTTEEQEELSAGLAPYRRMVQIPKNAPEGILRQRVKTIFYCNWLQRLLNIGSEFIMPDIIFQVSRKDP